MLAIIIKSITNLRILLRTLKDLYKQIEDVSTIASGIKR